MSLLETVLKEKTASNMVLKVLNEPKAYVRIIADEPARWFFEENEKEYWDQREEFRNIAPPFPAMWIEFKAPKYIRSEVHNIVEWSRDKWQNAAVFLVAEEVEQVPQEFRQFPSAKWIVTAQIFTDRDEDMRQVMYHSFLESAKQVAAQTILDSGLAISRDQEEKLLSYAKQHADEQFSQVPDVYESFMVVYGVREDGSMAPLENGTDIFLIHQSPYSQKLYKMPMEGLSAISTVPITILNVALLSVYFMHAKGTELKTKQVPEKLRKAREKKRKKQHVNIPTVTFKVLDIGLGMRQALDQAKKEGGGLSKALHLRRGHFKVFTKPMFGKGKTGDVWVRPHWVGQEELGEVKKTYRVKKPDPEKPEQDPGSKLFRYNPGYDLGSEQTGAFEAATGVFDAKTNVGNIPDLLNWDALSKVASQQLPGAEYMMRRALVAELAKRSDLKRRFEELFGELIEGAESRMIGNQRSRKLRRYSV